MKVLKDPSIEATWPFQEMLEEIQAKLAHIDKKLFQAIHAALLKDEIIQKEQKIWFTPDFWSSEDWRIRLQSINCITESGIVKEEEKITDFTGRLFVLYHGVILEPSFKFSYESKTNELLLDLRTITKVLADRAALEKSVSMDEKFQETLKTYDLEQQHSLRKILEKTGPMFTQLGFSKDEANVMVLGAIAHDEYTADMQPENVVGLALKIRGQNMAPSSNK